MRRYAFFGFSSAFVTAAVLATPLAAKDYFLTIGGGYQPSGNQASIESNVLLQARVLADKRPDHPRYDVYFSDGDDAARNVQVRDEAQRRDCPPAARLMTEVFGDAEAVGLTYRTHQVADVTGPSERETIRRRFRQLGRELKKGDRLIVYVTGHGSGANESGNSDYDYEYDYEKSKWVAKSNDESSRAESNKYDTSLYLWNSEQVKASEFGRWLDDLAPEVKVVMVMVQCYAGGFAQEIFHRNDAELGLSPCQRCGFFAQIHTRGAAGCTPEADEADYHEYSTYFWAALDGKSRTGEALEPPDYNKDGRVSFAEAHAYTVIESETVDIPVRTSEALLRRYSRLGRQRADKAEKAPEDGSMTEFFGFFSPTPAVEGELLNDAGPLAPLAAKARPDQRAILEQLPKKLGLTDATTVEAVRQKVRQATGDGVVAAAKLATATKAVTAAKKDLRADVSRSWPELERGFAPVAAELTGPQAGEFTKTVEALPSYQAWTAARKQEQQATDEYLAAQCREAKAQRLLRTIKDVALAENLPKAAPSEIVARYWQIVALEEESLVEPDGEEGEAAAKNATAAGPETAKPE